MKIIQEFVYSKIVSLLRNPTQDKRIEVALCMAIRVKTTKLSLPFIDCIVHFPDC